jgi:hypothetical protein
VMIHAKWGTQGVKIGDLYTVLGQAEKNAHHLWTLPSDATWDRWTADHSTGRRRLRRGTLERSRLEELFVDHHTVREVWVVQPALDVTKLLAGVSRKQPEARILRMAYLLDHTSATVASTGSLFRLFGS